MNPPRCSRTECDSSPAPGCLVVACVAHCDHWQCSLARVGRGRSSRRSHVLSKTCRDPSCDERVHPECSSRSSITPAGFVHTAGRQSGENGPAILLCGSFCVASINARRRLWQRDQSIHDRFRVFPDLLLENHVGVVAFKRCSLVISRRYPLNNGFVGSGKREAGSCKRVWFPRPLKAGFHQCQVAGVQQCLVHLHTLCSTCRTATRDPCEILEGHCPTCADCSHCPNGHQGKRQRLAPSFQPLNPDRAMCESSSFWSCSWLLADWSCAIPNGGQHC